MRKGLLGLLFCFFSIIAFSQSIPSYWMNIYGLDKLYLKRNENVKQMIVNVTGFYSSGSNYEEKWIFNFQDSGKIIGQKFMDGQLVSNFEYEFDTLGNIIQEINNSKLPLRGWNTLIIQKEFHDGHLILEKHLDGEKKLSDFVRFDYDASGKPIKLSLNNSLGQLMSYETAEYNMETLTYDYKVFNSKGELISHQKNYCDPDTSANRKNDYHDYIIVKWPGTNPDTKILHHFEYEYDSFGNWTKRKWLIAEGKKNTKRSITTRKIIYSNTNPTQ